MLEMRRRGIQAKFVRIVEFSGVGGFVETPVKWYSSGMYVRLNLASDDIIAFIGSSRAFSGRGAGV
jgi:ABC-type polysaccharide/polyol phosphate transport system ATPase subunit